MNSIAEVFPPGEFLKEELEARGWSQTALAEIMGRPVRLINEIIAGKKGITPETAIQLGESLGTGPELWMNLESQYQLSKVRGTDGLIRRRAKLYEGFPVREMMKRGWIEASKNIEVVEQQLRDFFGLGLGRRRRALLPCRAQDGGGIGSDDAAVRLVVSGATTCQ